MKKEQRQGLTGAEPHVLNSRDQTERETKGLVSI